MRKGVLNGVLGSTGELEIMDWVLDSTMLIYAKFYIPVEDFNGGR